MRSDENQIEDCDVRARLRRAFEIDEGIEIPSSVFNSPQFQVNLFSVYCIHNVVFGFIKFILFLGG